MTILSQQGYLSRAYLADPYMQGQVNDGTGSQVEFKIVDDTDDHIMGQQLEARIFAEPPIGQQVEARVFAEPPIGSQALMAVESPDDDHAEGMQVDMAVGSLPPVGSQVEGKVLDQEAIGSQAAMFIESPDDDHKLGSQVEYRIFSQPGLGQSVRFGLIRHALHPKYCTESEGYLMEGYLADKMCGYQGMQVEGKIVDETDDHIMGQQVDLKIEDLAPIGSQAKFIIAVETPVGIQVRAIRSVNIGSQANYVIYNDTQLRFLCDFASRGTEALGGTNWTASPAEAAGDFSPNNLNTDILEQRYQSDDGDIALVILTCDTGKNNTFVDTIGILSHNLTRSARVTVQASNDPLFGSIGQNFVMTTELEDMYWISPNLPTLGFRYWRFLIEDSTNTENNIKVGTVVFGSAQIFTKAERFTNPVTFGEKHFKDSIETEGFTNVSNDRATRKFLGLSFTDLAFNGSNYLLLKSYFSEAKTDLKCLVIPTPQNPSTFAVFSKLVQLPQESHKAIEEEEAHYVDLSLEWDESQ